MRFIISSTALFGRIQAISRVINSKNSLPILDCLLFEINDNTLTLTASDTETRLITSLEVIESDSNARFCINAKNIQDSLKEISEQPLTFDINLDTMEITIQYQNGHFNITGQEANEYPTFVTAEKKHTLELQAQQLVKGINCCIFATADNELRPIMNGIYLDINTSDVTFVATDGQKLVRNKMNNITSDGASSFILPKKPATILKNLLPKEDGAIAISFDNHNAIFAMPNFTLICRLVEGRYPNYNAVIPTNNPNCATIDRVMMLSALKRVLIFSNQSSSLIKIHLENNMMTLSGQDFDFSTSAEEAVPCSYDGAPFNIGFKGNYLLDILNNLNSTEVTIELADPSRAGVIVPTEQDEDENTLMLLMPLLLND